MHPQAFTFVVPVLITLGIAGCNPQSSTHVETDGRVEAEAMPVVKAQYGMEFVWIPPSGERWERECLERGIPYQPVAGFYLQTRELSLKQYREMGGDVEGYSTLTDVDWNQSAIIADWVQAVNWGHFLSSHDPKFDYRLPTIHEWLLAYLNAANREPADSYELKFEEVNGGCFEFATDSVLEIVLPLGYEAAHAPETARRSFAMGQPYGFGNGAPKWDVIPNRTPPTGDDGIDEQTFVRFVLVPKPIER